MLPLDGTEPVQAEVGIWIIRERDDAVFKFQDVRLYNIVTWVNVRQNFNSQTEIHVQCQNASATNPTHKRNVNLKISHGTPRLASKAPMFLNLMFVPRFF